MSKYINKYVTPPTAHPQQTATQAKNTPFPPSLPNLEETAPLPTHPTLGLPLATTTTITTDTTMNFFAPFQPANNVCYLDGTPPGTLHPLPPLPLSAAMNPHAHPLRQQFISSNGALNSAVAILTAADSNRPINHLIDINEGGRVGIYDVNQRKARIELFHSKRAARIWRKRIKYDCRKKFADSRPRIKGRFVKRSDMSLPPEEIQRIYGGQLPKNVKVTITPPKTPPSASAATSPMSSAKKGKSVGGGVGVGGGNAAQRKQKLAMQAAAKATKDAQQAQKLKAQRMEMKKQEEATRLQEQHEQNMYEYEGVGDGADDGFGVEDGYGLQDFGVPRTETGDFFF